MPDVEISAATGWLVYSQNPFLGTTTWFRSAKDDKGQPAWEFVTVQDPTPIFEQNHALATHNDGFSPSRDYQRIAAIPSHLVREWKQKHGVDIYDPNHAQGVERLIRDPDYRKVRTSSGNI